VAGYRLSLSWLNRSATGLTGIVQNGSLPVYLAVIWATVLLLPGVALLQVVALPEDLRLAESPLQLLAAAAVVVTAVVVGAVRHRLLAVLLMGGVGYGVAVLFLIQGAPDLALTQLLVETLGVVIFVLVLRHLPARFEPVPWRIAQVPRLLVAGAVGVFVTLAALTMAAQQPDRSVSEEIVASSLPVGEGKNVVNVILVDIRALDTLGEITVILVAALGIHSLIRMAGRREESA
jgi:multicomponent Na+:H+ antiporter subunit A